jgi:hypothetical protein
VTLPSYVVTVDPGSLSRSALGQISGIIYVELDGIPFPGRGWSDAVVGVLLSWLDTSNDLAAGVTDSGKLRFMDGPFSFAVQRLGARVSLRAMDSRRGDHVIAETNVQLQDLLKSMVSAASQVLGECSERNWWSPEIDRLVLLFNDSRTQW